MDYRHFVILGSVVVCMTSTLAGLKYCYSPTKSKIFSSKTIKRTKKNDSITNNTKEEKTSNYNINLGQIKFISPPEHSFNIDTQKDSKKFMGVMKNLGAIVK